MCWGRFSKSASMQFRQQCRAAIATGDLEPKIFEAWDKCHDRRRVGIKKNTSKNTRDLILHAEAGAYERLVKALDSTAHRRIEANTERIEATVEETLGTLNETKEKVDKILAKVCPEVIIHEGDIEAGIAAMTPQQASRSMNSARSTTGLSRTE